MRPRVGQLCLRASFGIAALLWTAVPASAIPYDFTLSCAGNLTSCGTETPGGSFDAFDGNLIVELTSTLQSGALVTEFRLRLLSSSSFASGTTGSPASVEMGSPVTLSTRLSQRVDWRSLLGNGGGDALADLDFTEAFARVAGQKWQRHAQVPGTTTLDPGSLTGG